MASTEVVPANGAGALAPPGDDPKVRRAPRLRKQTPSKRRRAAYGRCVGCHRNREKYGSSSDTDTDAHAAPTIRRVARSSAFRPLRQGHPSRSEKGRGTATTTARSRPTRR